MNILKRIKVWSIEESILSLSRKQQRIPTLSSYYEEKINAKKKLLAEYEEELSNTK